MKRDLSILVVGLAHPNADGSNRQFIALTCAPGDRVDLLREPKNKVDPQAVAVLTDRGGQIGYITAERCQWIGSIIGREEEVKAIFQGMTSTTAVIRVAIGGHEPKLPPGRAPSDEEPAPAEEPDWYPDEIPPDEFDS